MAQRCGMSVKHYGDIERGTIDSGLTALDTLARGVGMNITELCGLALGTPVIRGKEGTLNLAGLEARTVRRVQRTLPLVECVSGSARRESRNHHPSISSEGWNEDDWSLCDEDEARSRTAA